MIGRRFIVAGLMASIGASAMTQMYPFRPRSLQASKPGLTSFAAASVAAFTVTQVNKPNGQPARANDVFQRTAITGGGQGKGTGAIAHVINVTSIGTIMARRRSASDGVTIVQAPWVAGTVSSTGNQTFNVTGVDAPAIGTDAATPVVSGDGTFYLDLSGDYGATWTNGTLPLHMGDLSLWWGQSLVWYGFTRLDAVNIPGPISPYGRCFAQFTGYTPALSSTAWELPSNTGNYKGAMVAEYLRCMVSASGVANGVAGLGIGGTLISLWQQGQANMNLLLSILAAAGGSFRWEYGMIGHTDSQIASSDSYFQGALTNSWSAVRGANAYPTPTRTIASIPGVDSALVGDWTMVNTIRQAAKTWAGNNNSAYIQPLGLKMVDNTHQTNGVGGGDYLARELFRSYRPALGLAGSNAGVSITSVSRVGAVITANLSGTPASFTGAPHKRFRVFDTGNLNAPRAIASSAINGNTITFTLAADPGVGAVLDLYPYTDGYVMLETALDLAPDTFFDTNITADETALGFTKGRQVDFGTIGPINVPAVTSGGAVNAIPPYNMTATSPVYQTGASGFGNELASGSGLAAQSMTIPQPPTYTLEGWITIPSAPASNMFLMCPPDKGAPIGTNTSGQITVANVAQSSTSYTGAGRIFVRRVQTTTGVKFYIGTTPGAVPSLVNSTTFSGSAAYRIEGGLSVHARSDGTFANTATLPVDSMAMFASDRSAAPAPSASYAGNEASLLALYNFENNMLDSCTN